MLWASILSGGPNRTASVARSISLLLSVPLTSNSRIISSLFVAILREWVISSLCVCVCVCVLEKWDD